MPCTWEVHYYRGVERVSFFERPVQRDLAQLTPHGSLSQLRDRVQGVVYAVGGSLGIDYL